MMRGLFGLVSLLIVAAGAAYYFTAGQPEVAQPGRYQKIESQANAAAASMQNSAQAAQDKVDAANGATPPAPATNAAPSGN
jgi:hypothetical protein